MEVNDTFVCQCGEVLVQWDEYTQHVATCPGPGILTADLKGICLTAPETLFVTPPLLGISRFLGCTDEYDCVDLEGPTSLERGVLDTLTRCNMRPAVYGSYGSVYATETSHMEIVVREKEVSLQHVRDALQRHPGLVGDIQHIGSGATQLLRVYNPGKGLEGPYIDIALARNRKELVKRQPYQSLRALLRTEDVVGAKRRKRMLAEVARVFDTSSVDTLTRDVMLAWYKYNARPKAIKCLRYEIGALQRRMNEEKKKNGTYPREWNDTMRELSREEGRERKRLQSVVDVQHNGNTEDRKLPDIPRVRQTAEKSQRERQLELDWERQEKERTRRIREEAKERERDTARRERAVEKREKERRESAARAAKAEEALARAQEVKRLEEEGLIIRRRLMEARKDALRRKWGVFLSHAHNDTLREDHVHQMARALCDIHQRQDYEQQCSLLMLKYLDYGQWEL
ncbi:hypothetical protein KIPB_003838 [Kipferlia bialata]|uniref:Uncharacterized protein n=1 Tax=Kipferlia bialata TaxID=797122 RepID=A0A9K3GHM5_9EUKA|nr:hypothetical protein KIPB_003838 [Kipferlia bialata]|eukprot:g3838.t1